jgi:hypothetical protein
MIGPLRVTSTEDDMAIIAQFCFLMSRAFLVNRYFSLSELMFCLRLVVMYIGGSIRFFVL